MPYRVKPDDEVRRFAAVWLGPPGYSLPFHARYAAYGLGAAILTFIFLVELLTPIPFGVPPVWEVCMTVLATTAVMSAVDNDKPLGSAFRNVWNVICTARQPRDTVTTYQPTLPRKITTTRTPYDPPQVPQV